MDKKVGPFLVDDSIDVVSGPALYSYRHQWERVGIFSRCSVCGWGWKIGYDNDFPCPGVWVVDWPSQIS